MFKNILLVAGLVGFFALGGCNGKGEDVVVVEPTPAPTAAPTAAPVIVTPATPVDEDKN